MFSRTTWLIPTAFLLLFWIGAGITHSSLFVACAGFSLLMILVAIWYDFKPRDKYDLKALEDARDREELANLDPQVGVFEFDDYLCPYCRTLYSMEYRQCPKCGRARAR